MANFKISGDGSVNVISGDNLFVAQSHIFINGKEVTPKDAKDVKIEIQGNVQSLSADIVNHIEISGTVGSLKTTSGNVHCGDVSGSVETMSGDVSCRAVKGDVRTLSGDITRGD